MNSFREIIFFVIAYLVLKSILKILFSIEIEFLPTAISYLTVRFLEELFKKSLKNNSHEYSRKTCKT